MIDVLKKELEIHRINPLNRNVCEWDGKQMSINSCIKKHRISAQENKKIIFRLWRQLCDLLEEKSQGDSCEELRSRFIPAIKSLYRLASSFSQFKKYVITSYLNRAIDSDIDDF